MATIDTRDVCSSAPGQFDPSSPYETSRISIYKGTFFAGDRWGMAATVLSLVTNCVATLLIAYRAWQHRALVKSQLRQGCPLTRVERTLALLVESGVLYCALWVSFPLSPSSRVHF
ncbi:hypothetical protein C8Q76DRAFT_801054 [Earliella scabrosa]|nr:hypothetical protein C8Q76DRAFT_801054 [Earliella scabrosa]